MTSIIFHGGGAAAHAEPVAAQSAAASAAASKPAAKAAREPKAARLPFDWRGLWLAVVPPILGMALLVAIWAVAPCALLADPSLGGLLVPAADRGALLEQVGLIWLVVGAGGLLFRTVHLFFIRDVRTGLVWMTKILTDPFNDIRLYHRAPLHLMRGQLIDPMPHAAARHPAGD